MDVALVGINLTGGVVLNTKLPRRRRKKTAKARAAAEAVAEAEEKEVERAAAKAAATAVKRRRRTMIARMAVRRRSKLMCDAISASNGAT